MLLLLVCLAPTLCNATFATIEQTITVTNTTISADAPVVNNTPPTKTTTTKWQKEKSGKSKTIAGLLAIFLGGLGIHFFYMGYSKKGKDRLYLGLAVIGVSILAALLGLVVPILGLLLSIVAGLAGLALFIWGILDAINIFENKLKPEGGFED